MSTRLARWAIPLMKIEFPTLSDELLTFGYTFHVKPKKTKQTIRRRPVQTRAQLTVDSMLDAAVKLMKRGGISAITTNRIAEKAGVSIGSVYQYFPNKQAIFIALHARHVDQVDRVIKRRMDECSGATLEELVSGMMDGMMEVHSIDPEMFALLQSEVPDGAGRTLAFSVRFHHAFCRALAPYQREFGKGTDLSTRAFFVSNMIDAFCHTAVLRRPSGLSLARAKAESVRTVLVYLRH